MSHVELFARGKVVVLPRGVGTGRPWRVRAGRIARARCRQPVFTLDPSGVVFVVDRGATTADLFRAWGRPFGPRRLLSFRGRVRTYVEGRRVRGDPRTIRLAGAEQVALEVGRYVPPHRHYRYPPAFARLVRAK